MPDRTVFCLDPIVCPCSTMYRIHPRYVAWALDNLAAGVVVNRVSVDAAIRDDARLALDRMLAIC
jgi:quinolinate synthase